MQGLQAHLGIHLVLFFEPRLGICFVGQGSHFIGFYEQHQAGSILLYSFQGNLHFESCVLSMVSYYLGKCICTLIILLSLESNRFLLEMVPTIHNKMVEVAGSSLVNSLKDNFSVISISITCKSRSMHILIKSISQSLDFCINNARGHSYHGLKIGIVKE